MSQIEIKGFEEMLEFVATLPETLKSLLRQKLDSKDSTELKSYKKIMKFVKNFDSEDPIDTLIATVCAELINLMDVFIKADIAKSLTFRGTNAGHATVKALRSMAADIEQSTMDAEKQEKERVVSNMNTH